MPKVIIRLHDFIGEGRCTIIHVYSLYHSEIAIVQVHDLLLSTPIHTCDVTHTYNVIASSQVHLQFFNVCNIIIAC